ncbi:MAG: acyltransferase [Chlorobiaceae bacterium]|nr:acyltransferase [Chlorobiaceae bacterium]
MKYRPEIDGLRSIAVLPVILYHAGFNTFSGGFVGVDIFFVISGYLITSIILSEHNSNSFSLKAFYYRRARRILPALYFVLFVCAIICLFLLSPFDGRDFWQSLSATILFASNILFCAESSDYFGLSSEYKPLLHTWSLAVEEQYYILYPLVLLAAWRFSKKQIMPLLATLAVVSLAVAQWTAYHSPSLGFFLLPSRAWELLIGAFIAFYFNQKENAPVNNKKNTFIYETGGATGLLMICSSVFLFEKSTPFPSLYTLVPTVGAALIILFANPQTVVGRLLGSKLFVGIGLISYSAYLWHQPLFAFARYYLLTDLGIYQSIIVIVLTFALAVFCWQFIEKPFRNKSVISDKKLVSIFSIASVVLFSIGFAGNSSKGYQNVKLAFIPDYKAKICVDFFSELDKKEKIYREISASNAPDFNKDFKKKILILGDSMSGDFLMAVKLNANLDKNNQFIRKDLDDPEMDDFLEYMKISNRNKLSAGDNDKEFVEIKRLIDNCDIVVLAANLIEETAPSAIRLAEYLAKNNKLVYVVEPFRVFHMAASSYYFANSDIRMNKLNSFMYKRISPEYLTVRNYMSSYFSRNSNENIKLIDKARLFCDFKNMTCSLYSENGRPLIFDELHLTLEGEKYYGDDLDKSGYFIQ